VEGTSNPYKLVFEEGTVTAYITLDGSSNVAGLQFTEIINNRLTLSPKRSPRLLIWMEKQSVLIRKKCSVLFGHHADAPLAVGSAFKLGILAAVCDAIEAGRLQWKAKA
jgi:beta-lactamase class A